MNYIRRLQGFNAERLALLRGIADLRAYLCSAKFWVDTTVQTADVLRRLDELVHTAQAESIEAETEDNL